jgi:uncharacterized membrane protein YphA (DoxX/SURF4 family)
MTLVRVVARPLMSAIFITSGVKAIRKPEPLVPGAQPVADRLVPLAKKVAPPQIGDRIPESTKNLVRLNGVLQVVGGLMLASGSGRRAGAGLLASTLVPTTLAEHRFWEAKDPVERAEQQTHFMKNLGLLGGLLLAAVDTEGKPGLAWRASHGTRAAKREVGRSAKAAKRETRRAVKAAKREAAVAARMAKAELPFTD